MNNMAAKYAVRAMGTIKVMKNDICLSGVHLEPPPSSGKIRGDHFKKITTKELEATNRITISPEFFILRLALIRDISSTFN